MVLQYFQVILQLELEKLEKQISVLEDDAKRNGQLMHTMWKKVLDERQQLESNIRITLFFFLYF